MLGIFPGICCYGLIYPYHPMQTYLLSWTRNQTDCPSLYGYLVVSASSIWWGNSPWPFNYQTNILKWMVELTSLKKKNRKKKQLIFCTTARHPELETFEMDCLTQIKCSILYQTLNRPNVVYRQKFSSVGIFLSHIKVCHLVRC